MLGISGEDILGHALKGLAIGFGIFMVLWIFRSMKRIKDDQQGKKSEPGKKE